MRFHALLPVRDEADIIKQCLDQCLTWADRIYVFDTGSVDDTWEIVQSVHERDSRVIPIRKEPVYYSEGKLRGYLFNRARTEMEEGDWFLRIDADEFHHIDPPTFVRKHMDSHETIAYHQYFNFELTRDVVREWKQGERNFSDRSRPIEERLQYYTPSKYSEPRLCRYRSTMKWPVGASFPINAGYVAKKRLPIRHYPHRDPIQLARRCRLRSIMMNRESAKKEWSNLEEHHWTEGNWQSFITDANAPDLRYWEPGQALPNPGFDSHLAAPLKRLAQRFVHATLLPILDRTRNTFPEGEIPLEPIPDDVQETLREALDPNTLSVSSLLRSP